MTVINLRQNQKNENRICAQCAFRAGTLMWIKSNFCIYNQVLRMYSKLWTEFLFASIYSPSTKHTGHKSNQKTSFHNLHINFFPREHDNESCNLDGSLCSQDFHISAHGHSNTFVSHPEHP